MINKETKLLYQGQASIRITTSDGHVIYIDPYAGTGYYKPADLILMTHGYMDHCDIDKIEHQNKDCQIISWREAHPLSRYKNFDLGYVKVEPAEAGYNFFHSKSKCVGYVLTITEGDQAIKVYVSGDTSMTKQMAKMKAMAIDYAFYCCDEVFNMGLSEATECARMVDAKYNIPYHMSTKRIFDWEIVKKFDEPHRLIIEDGQEIVLKPASNL